MLPQEFLNRIEKQLGEEYPAFLESLDRPRAVALRFNPLKGEKPELPFGQLRFPIASNSKMGHTSVKVNLAQHLNAAN